MRRIRRPYLSTPPLRTPISRSYMGSNRIATEDSQTLRNVIPEAEEPNYATTDEQQSGSGGFHQQDFNCNNNDNATTNSISNCPILNTFNQLEQDAELRPDDSKFGRILKSIREVIACCACYSSEAIMKECINGHLICQNCFLTLRQDERPQCPTCRASLYSDSRRALVAQKVLSELPDICSDCGAPMLHKSLANHRMNSCSKRRVACGLSAIGCDWVGEAEQYTEHYHNCVIRKQFAEQPIRDNLDYLLGRFKRREQSIRETFHCFSSVLRHLESHELQTITVVLARSSTTETGLQYRSDHFHANQSRWTGEIYVNFPTDSQASTLVPQTASQGSVDAVNLDSELQTTDIIEVQDETQEGIDDTQDVELASESYILPWLDNVARPIRARRRWNQPAGIRSHPYRDQRRLFSVGPPDLQVVDDVQILTPDTTAMNSVATANHSLAENQRNIGEIKYSMLKENSPGIGRRAYAFVLLQIRVPETGIQIYARPQIQNYRFSNRGDQTAAYPVLPIRWRYISSLKEMANYCLIQADFVIARRIVDDHVES